MVDMQLRISANQTAEDIAFLQTVQDFERYLSVILHLRFRTEQYDRIREDAISFLKCAVQAWNKYHPSMPVMFDEVLIDLDKMWQHDLKHLQRIRAAEK